MPAKPDLAPVFVELRRILAAYERTLTVVHDTPTYYCLDTRTIGPNQRPINFGAVRIGKNYVSYYFMPIYAGAVSGMSPALKKRMQGKACFNFTAVDKALFRELKAITKRGYEEWQRIEWVD